MLSAGTYRIGIDLGGTKIAGVLLDEQGRLVAQRQVPTPQGDYAATVAAVVAMVAELQQGSSDPNGPRSGMPGAERHTGAMPLERADIPVGIGTPGVCLVETGLMANCNSTCLNGQPLHADLCKQLGPRVSIANDADCFALSEWRNLGAASSEQTMLGIILGTGVGAGIVHGGRLLRGPNALAGEWGHTPLPYFQADASMQAGNDALESRLGSRRCYCGRLNCIETFLSGPGLGMTHEALWQEHVSPEEIATAWIDDKQTMANLDSSDGRCRATLGLYLDMLARSLAQVINILDPQTIVVGGGLSSVSCLYQQLPQRIPRYLFSRKSCATQIIPPQGGPASGVFGAAWLD